MIVGYDISGPDNGGYMYVGAANLEECPACGNIVDREFTNPDMTFSNRRYTLSYTYDNRAIVSTQFYEWSMNNDFPGAIFNKLNRVDGFYHLQVAQDRIVEVCRTKREFNIGYRCELCGRHKAFCGKSPLFLERDEELGDGIYQTDIYFGSGKGRTRSYLVSPATRRKMEFEEFHGIDFHPVYSKSTEL